ncbi:MAG: hypothetical protein HC803_04640 [Saprospiraceae bacterium]|nr:hypothetical protein [Saprospiraceae bacterium]
MKQTLTIVLCCLAIAMAAQPINSDEVNYIFSFEDTKSEPIQNQEIVAQNLKETTEIHTKFTTEKGKVTFILKRGETYQIKYFDESFDAQIPTTGTSFVTKKIVYESKIKIENKTASDTIIFAKKPTAPTETEALFQLILKDKDGGLCKNLTVWMVQPKIGKTYQATTDDKGVAIFLLPIDYDYIVNFEHDANYKTITVPKMPHLRFRKGFTYTSNYMDIAETERNDTIFKMFRFRKNRP